MSTRKKSKWEDDDDDLSSPSFKKVKVESSKLSKKELQRRLEVEKEKLQVSVPPRKDNILVEDEKSSNDGVNISWLGKKSSYPTISGCRSVYCYERLNHIEEGKEESFRPTFSGS
jgi:cell division cycle 2-like